MGLWDDLANWASSSAAGVAQSASNTANWIQAGINNPGQAIHDTAQQVWNLPSLIDAQNHGFNSVEAYQAYLAKQPQSSSYYGTGNPIADNVLNTIGGVGVSVGAGLGPNASGPSLQGSMPHQGLEVPHTADQVMNAAVNVNRAYDHPAPAPTDLQMQNAINTQNATNLPAKLNYNAQPGQIIDVGGVKMGWNGTSWDTIDKPGMVWTGTRFEVPASNSVGMTNINLNTPAGVTPSNLNTANLRVGDHQTTPDGRYQTWNGTSWNDGNSAAAAGGPAMPSPTTPAPQVSTNTQVTPGMSATEWAAARDAIMHKYYTDMSYSPDAKEADLAKLGPQPNGNTASNPTTVPTPLPSQVPTVGVGSPNGPSGPVAPSGTDPNTAAGLGKILGIDPNIAAMLLASGGSAVTTLLAAHEQSKAATDSAAAQAAAQNAATAAQTDAFNKALQQNEGQFNSTLEVQKAANKQAQDNIAPWLAAGSAALPKLTDFDANNPDFVAPTFNEQNWQDPGYSFRLKEGLDALQNSASAKGLLHSGNTLKALNNYAQDSASQEYQNAFNRYSTDTTNSFNRFQTQRGTKLNELQSLAGIGQTASQQANAANAAYANNVTAAGNNASNAATGLYTGMGNAQAGGIIGAANANAAGTAGAANANASGYVGAGSVLTNALSQYMNYNQGQQSIGLMNALLARK